MKNHYFFKLTKIILLLTTFLTGSVSFSQSKKNTVKPKSIAATAPQVVVKDPIHEVKSIIRETPDVPANYTTTKVSISTTVSPEAKAEFLKEHSVGYYYVYTNDKGKIITEDELQKALASERAKNNNQTINPKN